MRARWQISLEHDIIIQVRDAHPWFSFGSVCYLFKFCTPQNPNRTGGPLPTALGWPWVWPFKLQGSLILPGSPVHSSHSSCFPGNIRHFNPRSTPTGYIGIFRHSWEDPRLARTLAVDDRQGRGDNEPSANNTYMYEKLRMFWIRDMRNEQIARQANVAPFELTVLVHMALARCKYIIVGEWSAGRLFEFYSRAFRPLVACYADDGCCSLECTRFYPSICCSWVLYHFYRSLRTDVNRPSYTVSALVWVIHDYCEGASMEFVLVFHRCPCSYYVGRWGMVVIPSLISMLKTSRNCEKKIGYIFLGKKLPPLHAVQFLCSPSHRNGVVVHWSSSGWLINCCSTYGD